MKHIIIADDQRSEFLPNFLMNNTLAIIKFEALVYDYTRSSTPEYNGGYWEFVEFENGAKAILFNDSKKVPCSNDGNWFEGEMSLLALSLASNLMACSHMSFVTQGDLQQRVSDNFYLLREVASEHEWFKSEAPSIFAIID